MKNSDVELIRRTLAGDDTAFTQLVRKYQKPVHALVWRKIGDFHIAEEITQDTFLKAYQRLSALKEPQSFASWLYVIASRRCIAWLRKKRVWMQSLEDTGIAQLERSTYSGHVIAENERTAIEAQREVVKKLLAKLPESDRTILTLRYFGEMSSAEIGQFLGVSANTIRSRLRRAQERLKKEESMIREALENFQITPNLTENIMREIERLKPVTPPNSKPFAPWAIAVSTLAVVLLMLGVSSRYLERFQKPYSFDAASEMRVELIEAPVVLNLEAEPDIRMQLGNANAEGRSNGAAQQPPDEILFAAAPAEGEDVSVLKQQWVQAEPARGTWLTTIFATPEGELYVVDGDVNIHKLAADGKKWQYISEMRSLDTIWAGRSIGAKWNDTCYVVPSHQLFASTDDDETWNLLYAWPEETYWNPVELVLTDEAFYLAFENGIFRSEDTGKTWEAINDGLAGKIESLVALRSRVHLGSPPVFAGTEDGLYRLEGGGWQRLEFPVPAKVIRSVAVAEERLYVSVEFGVGSNRSSKSRT